MDQEPKMLIVQGDSDILTPAWIKAQRGELTQEAFAERLSCSKSMVSKWERGIDHPMGAGAVALLRFAGLLREGTVADTREALDSGMTATERKLLESFRRLPEERQFEIAAEVFIEARKQHGAA